MKLKKIIWKVLKTLKSIGLTCHLDHETMITTYITNKKNYEVQFPTNPILKDSIEKKIKKK